MKLFLFALLAILLCAQTFVFGEEDSADYGLDGADREAVARAVNYFKRSIGGDIPDDGSGAVTPTVSQPQGGGGLLDTVVAIVQGVISFVGNLLAGLGLG